MTLNSKIAEIITNLINLFYPKVIEGFIPRHTFRYGVCGVVNSICLDSIFYFLIYHFVVAEKIVELGFVAISPEVAALILVFPITFSIGFWLGRNVAFHATQEAQTKQFTKYALSVCGSIILSYLSLKFLVVVCGIWPTPAKTISSIIVALYSYLAARHFTFLRKNG